MAVTTSCQYTGTGSFAERACLQSHQTSAKCLSLAVGKLPKKAYAANRLSVPEEKGMLGMAQRLSGKVAIVTGAQQFCSVTAAMCLQWGFATGRAACLRGCHSGVTRAKRRCCEGHRLRLRAELGEGGGQGGGGGHRRRRRADRS